MSSELIEVSVELTDDRIEADLELSDEQINVESELQTSVTVNAGTDKMTITAGENISSSNVIMIKDGLAYKYQPSDVANYGKAVGIAKNAVSAGGQVNIILGGKLSLSGWGLTADEIHYAIDDGGLSTTPPTTGLLSQIGYAKDTDTLIIEINEPIII